jgi:hypothetical protein
MITQRAWSVAYAKPAAAFLMSIKFINLDYVQQIFRIKVKVSRARTPSLSRPFWLRLLGRRVSVGSPATGVD